MLYFVKLSRKIYDGNNFNAYRRSLVFVVRSMLNYEKVRKLKSFLESSALRRDIATVHPAVFEQVTRCVFFRGATFGERLKLITDHLLFCENNLNQTALRQIYLQKGVTLWSSDYHGEPIALELFWRGIHYREGLISLILKIGKKVIYTVSFWIELNKKGEPVLKIGALQGKREGLDINRDLTKYFFGCRPKNFILFGLRSVAAQLAIKQIYAVSDYGYYANNHIRLNRKLKTSLDGFWHETGGTISADPRFFEIPITEPRKSIDEVVSHKRNYYRKRYALLDEIGTTIAQAVELYGKDGNDLEN